jgi:hypothetical protein
MWGLASHILNLPRWGVFSFSYLVCFISEERSSGGPQDRSEQSDEEKISSPAKGLNTSILPSPSPHPSHYPDWAMATLLMGCAESQYVAAHNVIFPVLY